MVKSANTPPTELVLPGSAAAAIAWANTLAPWLAVAAGYAIALHQSQAPACFPPLEGCTSISRAVREGDSLFWFRGWMLPLTPLLALYWYVHSLWLARLDEYRRRHRIIVWLGCLSALALTLYANFLGSDGDFYQFMRRFGVTFYFAFGLLGQLLALRALTRTSAQLHPISQKILRAQWTLVWAQWLLGLVSLAISIVQPEHKYEYHNIVEWLFAIAMTGFYGLSAIIWARDWRREP